MSCNESNDASPSIMETAKLSQNYVTGAVVKSDCRPPTNDGGTLTTLPSFLTGIEDEEMSYGLSLITGLRHRRPADSSTSSTSDKDDSGIESNTSSTLSKSNGGGDVSLSFSTVGPISSLSGSEADGNNSGMSASGSGSSSGRKRSDHGRTATNNRAGILRNNTNNRNKDSFLSTSSASSSSENISGGDELSERVVVRGKSLTSNSGSKSNFASSSTTSAFPNQENLISGPPCKVSFAEAHNQKQKRGRQSESLKDQQEHQTKNSTKRQKSSQSSSHEQANYCHGEDKSSKVSSSGSNLGCKSNDAVGEQNSNTNFQLRNNSVAAVSYTSSNKTSSSDYRQAAVQEPSDQCQYPLGFDDAPKFAEALHQPECNVGSPVFSSENLKDNVHYHSPSSPNLKNKSNSIKIPLTGQTLNTAGCQSSPTSPNKHHHDTLSSEERRLERNQREKERSNRIASQVDALRCLLQRGGLFIPKNTKSRVLSEASNYIRTLQDRQQLMSIEMNHLKSQLDVAMTREQQQGVGLNIPGVVPPLATSSLVVKSNDIIDPWTNTNDTSTNEAKGDRSQHRDYRLIFQNTMAGMAVATMGGALVDCNSAFEIETGKSLHDLKEMTVFNIVHPNDWTRALDSISLMIDGGFHARSDECNTASIGDRGNNHASENDAIDKVLYFRSSFTHRPDLGLCVTLVRDDNDAAKCFNVTLVKNVTPPPSTTRELSGQRNPTSLPFDPALPVIPSMTHPSSSKNHSSPQLGKRMDSTEPRRIENNGQPTQGPRESVEGNSSVKSPHVSYMYNNHSEPMGKLNTNNFPTQGSTTGHKINVQSPPLFAQPGANWNNNVVPPTGIPPHVMQFILTSQQQQNHQQQQSQVQQHTPMIFNARQGLLTQALQQQLSPLSQGIDPSSFIVYNQNAASGMTSLMNPKAMAAGGLAQDPFVKQAVNSMSSAMIGCPRIGCPPGTSQPQHQQQQNNQDGGPPYYASG